MLFDQPVIDNYTKPVISIVETVKQEPEKIEIEVKEGDTLEKLATAHNTTVQRLFNKNTTITHPDVIKPGDKLLVPENDEVLADRPLPVTIEATTSSVSNQTSAPSGRSSVSRPVPTPGNTYTRGYCTWYVKNRRPDMPNNLGNADTWYIRYTGAKGATPRAGAVGVAKGYMHVVIVESLNADGTVNISEMNYKGWNVVSSRTASASEFLYLY